MKEELPTLEEFSEETEKDEDLDILLIHHLLPDVLHFLEALEDNYNIEKIIGIPYSTKTEVLSKVREQFKADVESPDEIKEVREKALEFIQAYDDENLVIIDLGGYCSNILEDINQDKIKGIVEDTNQGHWEYEQRDIDIPIFSIAKGEIKGLENRVVGEAVTFSTERIIRNQFQEEITGKEILVMGYGGIGKAVATACSGRNSEVMVYDIDHVKMIEAKLDGYKVMEKEKMLERADIIIGATGKCSVGREEIKYLKEGCILSSGSSKQVEFDTGYLQSYGKIIDSGKDWKQYEITEKSIYLLNEGKPVNFLDNSISISIIDLIFSELLACVQALSNGENRGNEIREVPYEKKQEIAEKWLKFNN
ncbi:MAG: adenosylhomocysteinase [Candidatus Nanohalobium sp.]